MGVNALRSKQLSTSFAWIELAPRQPLDAKVKTMVSERPADALGGARPLIQIRSGSLTIRKPAIVRPRQLSAASPLFVTVIPPPTRE